MNLGLLLPCNAVVFEQEGRGRAGVVDAEKTLYVSIHRAMKPVAPGKRKTSSRSRPPDRPGMRTQKPTKGGPIPLFRELRGAVLPTGASRSLRMRRSRSRHLFRRGSPAQFSGHCAGTGAAHVFCRRNVVPTRSHVENSRGS